MENMLLLVCAIAFASGLTTLFAYQFARTRQSEQERVQARANRVANAAAKVGGYDELIELERERRQHNARKAIGRRRRKKQRS